MEQSQLIELIQTFQPEEKEQVLHFATLPLFNNGRMKTLVIPLLNICLNHPWHDSEQRLDKKQIFASLFPDQKFIEGKVEKVMVEAHKVVRDFLLVKHYFRDENEFYQTFDFSEIVRNRNLVNRHRQLLSRLKKMQEETCFRNTLFFHQQFLVENAIHENESLHNQRKGDLNIPSVLHSLDLYYYLNRIALLNRFILQQKVASLDTFNIIQSELEIDFVPVRYLEIVPSLKISYEIFTLLKKSHPEPSDLRNLFNLLILHESALDQATLREFYTYLRNMCALVLMTNPEQEEINFTLHNLYKDNLERGYLHYEGRLHPSRFIAISENAARVKQHEWALEFIQKYRHEIIDENESHDIYRLNMALYLFSVEKFSECLDYIPASSPFVDYLLRGKRLELKALYELRSELLPYKLDAFKMFLSRTSQKLLSKTQRQIHSDFANLLHQLVYSNPGDPKRSELLIKRIQEKKQSAEWRWLLEKAKALNQN